MDTHRLKAVHGLLAKTSHQSLGYSHACSDRQTPLECHLPASDQDRQGISKSVGGFSIHHDLCLKVASSCLYRNTPRLPGKNVISPHSWPTMIPKLPTECAGDTSMSNE